jgi:hypothetical protein
MNALRLDTPLRERNADSHYEPSLPFACAIVMDSAN